MLKFNGLVQACLRRFGAAVLALSVVACGGGGGSGGDPINGGGGGGGGTRTLGDLSVVLSRTSVTNNGSDEIDVTVTSLDTNRVALGNVPVSFSINNGGVITPAGTNTNATSGVITAVATIGADRTNRTITITVASGAISKTVSFNVVDSLTGGRVADLAMTTSSSSLLSDGSEPMVVTITTLDAGRLALGGSPVSLRISDPTGDAFVSNGGQQTTDPTTGRLEATVRIGNVRTKRSISLTASSGTVERTISFEIVDPVVIAPLAADMTLALSAQEITNVGSNVITVTATAVNSLRNAVPNIPVTFEVNANASIVVLNGLTNALGEAKAQVSIGSDRSERHVTVTARTAGLDARTATFRVNGVTIQSTALPALPAAGSTGNRVDFRVVDANQNPMVDFPITVTPSIIAASEADGPVVKSGRTDFNGAYVYTYKAPAQSGLLLITAAAAGDTKTEEVTVPSPTTSVPPATLVPSPPTLTLTPNVVRVNTPGDTTNRAEIRALFLSADASNAPVKNVRVRFELQDTNNIGGTVTSGANVLYTDANGVVVSSYSPADRASPTNGVTIKACWSVNDFANATDCPNASFINLTVVADPLSITIGTDNTIETGPTGLTYIKRFVLLVVDAAGNPKSDVQLTPSVDLEMYGKGFYVFSTVSSRWVQVPFLSCSSEDINRNGAIDGTEDNATTPGGFGNGNGQLDPRKSDVSISMVGSTRTDANGAAVMKLEYPKSYGSWVKAKISVAAAGVLSPPAYDTRWLPVSAVEVNNVSNPPSFVTSPYGEAQDCRNPN